MAIIFSSAEAAATQSDFQVAGRALSFTNHPPTGQLTVGIVYAPSVPASVEEAHAIQNLLADGLQAGDLVLKPALIDINNIANANAGIFFLTKGIGNQASGVLAASQNQKILCVTTDVSQVYKGYCGLGIRSKPRVLILVNQAVAERSGTTFSDVFRMMITII